jgi:hypothetical protein
MGGSKQLNLPPTVTYAASAYYWASRGRTRATNPMSALGASPDISAAERDFRV